MSKAICSECGSPVEIADGEEWGYCPMCENDQVEVKIGNSNGDFVYLLNKEMYELKIADLEAKLAESEENCFDLQQRLADKEEQCRECKHLNKKIELNIKNKLLIENHQLEQQLAESKKENTKLKEVVDCVDKLKQFNADMNDYALVNRDVADEIYCEHQDKISFCIEQLEKVKNGLMRYAGAICNEDGSIKKYDYVIKDSDFEKHIDNQIYQLKEMK